MARTLGLDIGSNSIGWAQGRRWQTAAEAWPRGLWFTLRGLKPVLVWVYLIASALAVMVSILAVLGLFKPC